MTISYHVGRRTSNLSDPPTFHMDILCYTTISKDFIMKRSHLMSAFKEQYPLNKDYPIRISHHDKCGGFPPPHYHRALEVVYCLKGPVKMEVNHSLYTLDTGDMIIVGSNHIHSYIPNYPSSTPESSTSDERYYMLIFDWDHLESIYKDKELFGNLNSVLLKSQVFRATQIDTQNYRQLFDDMYNEITGQRTGYKLAIISDLYRFLIFATRNSVPQLNTENDLTSLKKEHQFISLVNDYIFFKLHQTPPPPPKRDGRNLWL